LSRGPELAAARVSTSGYTRGSRHDARRDAADDPDHRCGIRSGIAGVAAREPRGRAVVSAPHVGRGRHRRAGHGVFRARAAASSRRVRARVPFAVRPPPGIRVRALDIGQGDAFLVEFDGRTLLVDGGPDPSRLLAELGASLPPWTRRIDVVALTHAHADHADGLIGVLERYEVGLAIEPVGLNPGPVAIAWNDRIQRAHVPRRAVAAGMRLRLGDATLAILAPDGDPRVDVPSLVI